MLSRSNRIKDKGKIDEVKSKGRLLQSDNFGIAYLKKTSTEDPRFAFIISTKISKLAVHRNRINRAMHQGVREALAIIPSGYDFVFLAKRSLEGKTQDAIIEEIKNFFMNFLK